MARRGTQPTVVAAPYCDWHLPSGLPYLAWHADAERRAEMGEKQRRCPDCGRWFWPHEWGAPDAD